MSARASEIAKPAIEAALTGEPVVPDRPIGCLPKTRRWRDLSTGEFDGRLPRARFRTIGLRGPFGHLGRFRFRDLESRYPVALIWASTLNATKRRRNEEA